MSSQFRPWHERETHDRPGRSRASRLAVLLLLLQMTASDSGAQASAESSAESPAQAREGARNARARQGRTVLVTGSTDGLGRELALALGATGAHVIVHGRNAERGQAVVAEITRTGPGTARFFAADFASLEAVRAFADTIAREYPRLDLLISNAGIWVPPGEPRRTSADGHELHFAVNYLPGWVLVHRLADALAAGAKAAGAPSRVISVASIAQSPIDFGDVMLERPGAHQRGYGQSKLAQVTMTTALAPEFAARGITMVSLHPATMMNTTMVRGSGMSARTTVDEGVEAVMALVNAPSLEPGAYFNGTRRATPHAQATDPEAQRRLRVISRRAHAGAVGIMTSAPLALEVIDLHKAVRYRPRRWTASTCACPRASASACSAPTAPARPPRSRSARGSTLPTAARCACSAAPGTGTPRGCATASASSCRRRSSPRSSRCARRSRCSAASTRRGAPWTT